MRITWRGFAHLKQSELISRGPRIVRKTRIREKIRRRLVRSNLAIHRGGYGDRRAVTLTVELGAGTIRLVADALMVAFSMIMLQVLVQRAAEHRYTDRYQFR